MMKKIKHTGFTLIELLVVITIILVISAVGFASYTNAQKKARDAHRIGDMKAAQIAFEQYFSVNQTYAACSTMATAEDYTLPTAVSSKYGYTFTCNSPYDTYCACAKLEIDNTGNSNAASCNTAFAAGGDYYCVEAQQ